MAYQSDYHKHINEFRKGTRLRTINEDPTYLSWFLMFDWQSESSPLFNGAANKYLEQVVGGEYGKALSKRLTSFTDLLRRINMEMPWFWQTISGVEAAVQYKKLEDPYWGADSPMLEIECLEENVDLNAITLMDLYKRAIYDFDRWIEIVPLNLRQFRMTLTVSEIRQFQLDTDARNLNSKYTLEGLPKGPSAAANGTTPISIHQELNLEAKPFIRLEFSHCEFDIDSISSMFADLGKSPEMKKAKIGIKWLSVRQSEQQYAGTISQALGLADNKFNNYATDPFDPKQFVQDAAKAKADEITANLQNRIGNLKDSIGGEPNGLANVYGNFPLSGAAANLANSALERLSASIFLGNVHGGLGLGSLQDAITAGSVNAIANLAGQLFSKPRQLSTDLSPNNIHPSDNVALDSSPDGNITPKKVYDPIAPDRDDPINENVYE